MSATDFGLYISWEVFSGRSITPPLLFIIIIIIMCTHLKLCALLEDV